MAYEYDPPNKFGYKDTLPEGDPEKIIKGSEYDDEFNNIAHEMQGLRHDVDIIISTEGVPEAPVDGDTYGRRSASWVHVADKDHSHEPSNIDGLPEFIANHDHDIDDVTGLTAKLADIDNKLTTITSNLVFGGTYDLENDIVPRSVKEDEGLIAGQPLPADGVIKDTFLILVTGGTMKGDTLARGDWIVADINGEWIPIPYSVAQSIEWTNIVGRPDFDNLYAPKVHTHSQYLEDAPLDGSQYCRKSGSWSVIEGITGDKGDGWTGGSYDAATGVVTFASDDGLGFATGDLRGTNQDSRITDTQISNWDTAFGWGNHANAGYSTYTGADAVKTSGAQTIGGAKTFSSNVTAPDFVATSDERAKDNISTAPIGLIDSLKGREWDWRESGEKGSGVVAQELEQVLPHLVHTDDEGMKSVAYNGLIAYLIEEIKDLKAQVEALK